MPAAGWRPHNLPRPHVEAGQPLRMRRMRGVLRLLHDLRLAQDAAREPRIVAETRELAGWLETPKWAYRLHPLPFHEACCFLDADKRCTIYETRPDVCREFAAGDEPCQTARAARGLPPLSRIDRWEAAGQ